MISSLLTSAGKMERERLSVHPQEYNVLGTDEGPDP